MVFTPLVTFIASTTLFVVLALFVRLEQKRGKRLVMGSIRSRLDMMLIGLNRWVKEQWRHFVRYILQLGWYYSLHSFLRTFMRVLVAIYDYLETHFERNRVRTKHLRAEKKHRRTGHLAKMAEHKAEIALTPEEEEQLRHQKLEEKH